MGQRLLVIARYLKGSEWKKIKSWCYAAPPLTPGSGKFDPEWLLDGCLVIWKGSCDGWRIFFFHCLDFTGSPKCVFHSVLTCCFHHQSPISVSKKTPTQLSLLFIWLFEICFFNDSVSLLVIGLFVFSSFWFSVSDLCIFRNFFIHLGYLIYWDTVIPSI